MKDEEKGIEKLVQDDKYLQPEQQQPVDPMMVISNDPVLNGLLPSFQDILSSEQKKNVVPLQQQIIITGKQTANSFKNFNPEDISLQATPRSELFNLYKRGGSTLDDFKEDLAKKGRNQKYKDKIKVQNVSLNDPAH